MIYRVVVEVSNKLAMSEKDAVWLVEQALQKGSCQPMATVDGYWHGRVKSLNRMLAGWNAQGSRRKSLLEWANDVHRQATALYHVAFLMKKADHEGG